MKKTSSKNALKSLSISFFSFQKALQDTSHCGSEVCCVTQPCSTKPCPEHRRLQNQPRGSRRADSAGQLSLGDMHLQGLRTLPGDRAVSAGWPGLSHVLGSRICALGAAPWAYGGAQRVWGAGTACTPPAKSISLTSFAAAGFRMARKYQFVVNVLFHGDQPGHTFLWCWWKSEKLPVHLQVPPSSPFFLQNRDARFTIKGPHCMEMAEQFSAASFLGTSSFRGISVQDGRCAAQDAQTSQALCRASVPT